MPVKALTTEQQLEYYRFMVETAHDGIFFKDLKSRYIIANRKVSEVIGLPASQMITKNDQEILPNSKEAQRNILDDKEIFRRGKPMRFVNHITGLGGREYWFDVIKTPRFDSHKRVVGLVGIARDITKQKKAEEILGRKLEFEKTLARISSRFVSALDIDRSIEESIADMGMLCTASRCGVFLFNTEQTIARVIHLWCAKGVESTFQMLQNVQTGKYNEWMQTLRKGKAIHIDDIGRMPQKSLEEKKILRKLGDRSLLLFPLKSHEVLTGFVSLANIGKIGSWTKDDLSMLSITSEIIGTAIARKNAENSLRKSEEALRLSEEKLRAERNSLAAKNTALKEVLQKIEEEKNEIKRTMVAHIEKIILPISAHLKKQVPACEKTYIEQAEKNLSDLGSSFVQNGSFLFSCLTPKQLEVCTMIRNGYRSKEIAAMLHVSPLTINRYREFIRKKLKLSNKAINLQSYLQSL